MCSFALIFSAPLKKEILLHKMQAKLTTTSQQPGLADPADDHTPASCCVENVFSHSLSIHKTFLRAGPWLDTLHAPSHFILGILEEQGPLL